MQSIRTGRLVWAALSLLAAAPASLAAPAIDAGADQIGVPLSSAQKGNLFLTGTAPEPYDSALWTQLAGPSQAQIGAPASLVTAVTIADTGSFSFVLHVYYGLTSSVDTTVITVRPSLPWVILTPANNAEVRIGQPCTIRWQMDPSLECAVYVSVDGGRTYTEIATHALKDSMVWSVDTGFADNTAGMIKVAQYSNKMNYVTSTFVLVRHAPQSVLPGHERYPRSAARVRTAVDGAIDVTGLSGPARLVIVNAAGKTVFRGEVHHNGRRAVPAALRGVNFCRLDSGSTTSVTRPSLDH